LAYAVAVGEEFVGATEELLLLYSDDIWQPMCPLD
jgi:hypothetical protein